MTLIHLFHMTIVLLFTLPSPPLSFVLIIPSPFPQMSEGGLVALSQDLCECLQRAPQSFSSTELKVTENKEAFDVTYPDAAFLLVSCVNDRSTSSRPSRCVCMHALFVYFSVQVLVSYCTLVARLTRGGIFPYSPFFISPLFN